MHIDVHCFNICVNICCLCNWEKSLGSPAFMRGISHPTCRINAPSLTCRIRHNQLFEPIKCFSFVDRSGCLASLLSSSKSVANPFVVVITLPSAPAVSAFRSSHFQPLLLPWTTPFLSVPLVCVGLLASLRSASKKVASPL